MYNNTNNNDLIIRCIKILDIAYITGIYLAAGITSILILDKYLFPHITINKNKKKTNLQISLNIIIYIIIIAIISYILRNIFQQVPFPLDGKYGFKHNKVKELISGQIITYIMLLFCKAMHNSVAELQRRYLIT